MECDFVDSGVLDFVWARLRDVKEFLFLVRSRFLARLDTIYRQTATRN